MSQSYIVTGALGCIGAWIVKEILDRGEQATVFDLPGEPRRLRELVGSAGLARVKFVEGDVTELESLCQAIEESNASYILHLAGLQVPFCKADPAKGALVNVLGTIQVFEAAKRLNLERVVYASSAAVYGPAAGKDAARGPHEGVQPEANTHYGVFKRANEGNARIYWQDDGISSVGLRPLTVYGVGRDQGMTSGPTTAMRDLARGASSKIAFSGSTDFLYAGDCAAAFLACAERAPAGAQVYNLSGDSLAVTDFVAKIEEEAGNFGLDARGKIQIDGPQLPIPAAIDGTALERDVPGIRHTTIQEGIRDTLRRFCELETTEPPD